MDADTAFYVKAIEGRKTELKNSAWLDKLWSQLASLVQNCDEIRCLALGSFTDYVNPRFQLALLLLIAEKLNSKKITAWDPVFNKDDRAVLAHYNIEVTETDPDAHDSLLWYVPHGPLSLVANLPSKIGVNVYIGNDLSKFNLDNDNNNVNGDTLEAYKTHAKIVPITTDKHDRWFLAFSSTAIHKKEK